MANSLDSDDCGASAAASASVQRSLVEATIETSSHGEVLTKCSDSFATLLANSFDNFENNGDHGVALQESDAYDSVVAKKAEMGVQKVVEQTLAAIQEEELVKCSTKCPTEIQVVDGTELIGSSALGNGEFDNDGNVTKRNRKQQEPKEKKEKKPRRRGGKARKDKGILNCYFNERREKKGLQYSREEMEALRFEKLDEQKKKWIEVYCGFGPVVAQEYDDLVEMDQIHEKDSVPSFDFDPRLQFQKSVNLGEDSPQFADNQPEDLSISNPSSFLPNSDETGFSVVEEACSEDDNDSDEDYSSIQRPAFLVTGEPDFDSGPPQDGLEYLRRVRWETARIPKVKVAKVNKIKEQTPYMPQIPDVMKCPENLLPLKQWEDSFLADFSELRQAFTQLDLQGPDAEESSIKLQSVFEKGILGHTLESNTFEKYASPCEATCMLETSDGKSDPHSPETSSSKNDRPTLATILKMDSAARTTMLKRRISSIENMSRISNNESLWLFALCVAVDCPLHADTSAAFRSLLRKCASLRAAKAEVDDEVIILNILVTISGRYFGQLEK